MEDGRAPLTQWLRQLEADAGGALRREPGMEFAASHAWWGDKKPRPRSHEGVDLVFDSPVQPPVKAIEAGLCVAVIDDFLGQSVFIEAVDKRVVWVYAHLTLDTSIALGVTVTAETALGRAAVSTKACPGHLHLSRLQVLDCGTIDWSQVQWSTIHTMSTIRFLPVVL